MVAMLCTRCHEREADIRGPSPEARARLEQRFGAPWPFPDDICTKCLVTLWNEDPEGRAGFDELKKKINAKVLAETGAAVRAGVLKVMDLADRLASAMGPK